MRNECIVGGEFAIDINTVRGFEKDVLSPNIHMFEGERVYSSGREAYRVILESLGNIEGIVLPDYICGSIPVITKRMEIATLFYHIQEDLYPDIETIKQTIKKYNVIMLVNYFGLLDLTEVIREIREEREDVVIIIDNVQNFYGVSEDISNDYSFTSFRKWFAVPDGAVVISNTIKPGLINKSIHQLPTGRISVFSQYKFAGNILKNYRDLIGDEICLKLINKGESILDAKKPSDEIDFALDWTTYAMNTIDCKKAEVTRRNNAKVLHEGLKKLDINHLYNGEKTPLFIPILLERDRDRIRRVMFENNVFCPVHWSDKWQKDFSIDSRNILYDRELSLICDQRYGEREMNLQLEILERECKFN